MKISIYDACNQFNETVIENISKIIPLISQGIVSIDDIIHKYSNQAIDNMSKIIPLILRGNVSADDIFFKYDDKAIENMSKIMPLILKDKVYIQDICNKYNDFCIENMQKVSLLIAEDKISIDDVCNKYSSRSLEDMSKVSGLILEDKLSIFDVCQKYSSDSITKMSQIVLLILEDKLSIEDTCHKYSSQSIENMSKIVPLILKNKVSIDDICSKYSSHSIEKMGKIIPLILADKVSVNDTCQKYSDHEIQKMSRMIPLILEYKVFINHICHKYNDQSIENINRLAPLILEHFISAQEAADKYSNNEVAKMSRIIPLLLTKKILLKNVGNYNDRDINNLSSVTPLILEGKLSIYDVCYEYSDRKIKNMSCIIPLILENKISANDVSYKNAPYSFEYIININKIMPFILEGKLSAYEDNDYLAITALAHAVRDKKYVDLTSVEIILIMLQEFYKGTRFSLQSTLIFIAQILNNSNDSGLSGKLCIENRAWDVSVFLYGLSTPHSLQIILYLLENISLIKEFLPPVVDMDTFLHFKARQFKRMLVNQLTNLETFKFMLNRLWFIKKLDVLSKADEIIILKPLLQDVAVFKKTIKTPQLLVHLLQGFKEHRAQIIQMLVSDIELYMQCVASAADELDRLKTLFNGYDALLAPLLDYDRKLFKGSVHEDFLLFAADCWKNDRNKLNILSQYIIADPDEFKRLITDDNLIAFHRNFPNVTAFNSATSAEAFKLMQNQKEKSIIRNTMQLILQGRRSPRSLFSTLYNQDIVKITSYLTINKFEKPEKECHLLLNQILNHH